MSRHAAPPSRWTCDRRLVMFALVVALVGLALVRAPAGHAADQATRPVDPAKPIEIKPYVPPRIEPEPALDPADTKVVMGPADQDLPIVVRPTGGMPALGFAPPGARLPVRGMYDAPSPRGCSAKRWYAIDPRGWVCAGWVRRRE